MTADDNAEAWNEFFERVYDTEDEFMDQLYLSKDGLLPTFDKKDDLPETLLIKSNRHHHLTEVMLERVPNLRMIALVRNPLAVISSWINNPIEFPADAEPLKEWRSGSCRKTGIGEYWGFDDWKLVTAMHLQIREKYPERFFLYRYEDIAKEPYGQARQMFNQINVQFSDEVDDFIRSSVSKHVDHPRSVYKKNHSIDKWKSKLDPLIIKEIRDDLMGTQLEMYIEG